MAQLIKDVFHKPVSPEVKCLHLFSGIGGGALGFQQAHFSHRGVSGKFVTLAGVDVDPIACESFTALTGAPALCMDLFSREQYIAFHGQEPPLHWREITPEELRFSVNGRPDIVFLSSPCKGLSGLLSQKLSVTPKYQALNRLTVRGIRLTLDAWRDNLPAAILFEQVPRIQTRGAALLVEIKEVLTDAGYVLHEQVHDCGEIGGLGQTRRRYLLIARHPQKLSSFICHAPKLKLRSIGDVIGAVPLPGDPSLGSLHRLPNLAMKTWVRLALIPAGGDWRDLEKFAPDIVDGKEVPKFAIVPELGNDTVTTDGVITESPEGRHVSHYRVMPFGKPANTVTGATHVANGSICAADPRVTTAGPKIYRVVKAGGGVHAAHAANDDEVSGVALRAKPGRPGALGVMRWEQAAGAVTGSAAVGGSTAAAIADVRVAVGVGFGATLAEGIANPMLDYTPRGRGTYGVQHWDQTGKAVVGSSSVKGTTAVCVGDPRVSEARRGSMGVQQWDKCGATVTASVRVTASDSPASVADPRLNAKDGFNGSPGLYGVMPWDRHASTVTGSAKVTSSNCPAAIADVRLGNVGPKFSNAYKVLGFDETSVTVASGGGPSAGAVCTADPRKLPYAPDVPIILAEDGTWHRPLTTLELALLQSFPLYMADGRPLQLAGRSDTKWREHIGNAVPPAAAAAIGVQILAAFVMHELGELMLASTAIWVKEEAERTVERILIDGMRMPIGLPNHVAA